MLEKVRPCEASHVHRCTAMRCKHLPSGRAEACQTSTWRAALRLTLHCIVAERATASPRPQFVGASKCAQHLCLIVARSAHVHDNRRRRLLAWDMGLRLVCAASHSR